MTEINPRMASPDEPVCSGEECPRYGRCGFPHDAPPVGDACLPMLRRLLAERTAERDAAQYQAAQVPQLRTRIEQLKADLDNARRIAVDGALCDEGACRMAGCNHYTGRNPQPTDDDRRIMARSLGWQYLYAPAAPSPDAEGGTGDAFL